MTQLAFDDDEFDTIYDEPVPVETSAVAHFDPITLDRLNIEATVRSYFGRMPKPTPENAWVHLYRLILWYEERVQLPSIIDGNEMQVGKAWHPRAKASRDFIARQWGIPANEIPNLIDVVMRAHGRRDSQRRNTSGDAFEFAIQQLLVKTGGLPASRVVRHPSVGSATPDIAVLNHLGQVALILMLKWSMRDDRIREFASEALCYRQALPSARIVVVTNEHDSGRLERLLGHRRQEEDNGFRYDAVYHVSPDAVFAAYGKTILRNATRFHGLAKLLTDEVVALR